MNEVIESTTDETPEPTLEAPEPPQEPEAGEADQGDDSNPNHEARKWRTRLRETEEVRDTLAGQLDAARAALVDSHLATLKGFNAGTTRIQLEAGGYVIADLLDEDGSVDTVALDAAIVDTRNKLGIQPARMIVPNEGNSPDRTSDVSWAEALNNRN